MKAKRNVTINSRGQHMLKSRFLLIIASLFIVLLAGEFSGILHSTTLTHAETTFNVVFDFDTGSPPPSLYQNTPFDYLTSNAVTAHFSSPSDIIAPAFSIQNMVPLGYNMSMFSGQWLYDNQITRDYLDVEFNAYLYSVDLTFAVVEPHGGPGTIPSYINLTAYMDSIGNQIGWTWARGETASEQNTQGILSFTSIDPFNLIRIWIPSNQPPFNPTDFYVDNIIVNATFPPDTTPPVTTINLNGTLGNQGWYKSDVTISLSATDDLSGVNRTEYSYDNTTWTAYSTSFTITAEGTKTIYYRSTDFAGNVEQVKTGTVKIDKSVPTGSIVIDGGAASTNSSSVTLTLTSNDAISGVFEVRYSNDGVWDTEQWEPPSATRAWNLTPGNGTRYIYYQIKDNAGLVSVTYQDSIVVETVSIAGDVNRDGRVDIYDAILLSNAFNSNLGDPNWNANADLNNDGTVDIFDAIILSVNFGKSAP